MLQCGMAVDWMSCYPKEQYITSSLTKYIQNMFHGPENFYLFTFILIYHRQECWDMCMVLINYFIEYIQKEQQKLKAGMYKGSWSTSSRTSYEVPSPRKGRKDLNFRDLMQSDGCHPILCLTLSYMTSFPRNEMSAEVISTIVINLSTNGRKERCRNICIHECMWLITVITTRI